MNEEQKEQFRVAVAQKCGQQVTDLVGIHLADIIAAMDEKDSDKAGVSIALSLERGPSGITIKTRLSFTSKTVDEAEGYVDRPDQQRIDFGKGAK
jgi:hypothetical protein